MAKKKKSIKKKTHASTRRVNKKLSIALMVAAIIVFVLTAISLS